MMLRRNMSWIRVFAFFTVVGLLVVGFYSYHKLQLKVRDAEDREERVKSQLDSASSQLDVLFKQKQDVDSTLENERKEHQQAYKDLRKQMDENEANLMKDKNELIQHMNALTSENGRLQGRVDDLQTEIGQLKEKEKKLLEDMEVIENQNKEEYMALKQERDSKVASLSDEILSLKQHATDMDNQLKVARTKNTQLQAELEDAQKNYSDEASLLKDVQKKLADLEAKHQADTLHITELQKLQHVDENGRVADQEHKNEDSHNAVAKELQGANENGAGVVAEESQQHNNGVVQDQNRGIIVPLNADSVLVPNVVNELGVARQDAGAHENVVGVPGQGGVVREHDA